MARSDISVLRNSRFGTAPTQAELREWLSSIMFGIDESKEALAVISQWEGYRPTPLLQLTKLARELDVGIIHYKNEAERFNLRSFKALGGAYAVYKLLSQRVEIETGIASVSIERLLGGEFSEIASKFAIASATAGNHGRSVAWGASMFGCPCNIYVHKGVSQARANAIAAFRANIISVDGNYDDSVRIAARDSEANGWTVVSDTTYPGYNEIPRLVMTGYSVMFAEILEVLGEARPTHIIIPVGVGGLAAAVVTYFALHCGDECPKFIMVEPEKADCLYQTALHGVPRRARGGLGSVMLGLDCGEVSELAWLVLERLAYAFVLITDEAAVEAMRDLGATRIDGEPIEAGECAGAGLAVLRNVKGNPALRDALGISSSSRILLIGTEGATDPERRENLLLRGLEAQMN